MPAAPSPFLAGPPADTISHRPIAGSPLPEMFLGCFVPRKTPAFSPSAGGQNRAWETEERPLPHPLTAAGDTGAAAWASAALCCVPGEGAAPPRPDGTSAPMAALTRAGRCLRSTGKRQQRPAGRARSARDALPAGSAAPRLDAAPLAFSFTHPRRTSRAPWVSTCSRGASARSPASPSARGGGGGKRARCPGLPPRSAAAARPRRRRHCSGGLTKGARRQPLIFPVPLHAGERSAWMQPRPSSPAAAGETTSPVWPRAPRRGGAGRSAAPGAAPRWGGRSGGGGGMAESRGAAGPPVRGGECAAGRVGVCAPPIPSFPRSRLGPWDGAGAAVSGMGSDEHVWGSRGAKARRGGARLLPVGAGFRGEPRTARTLLPLVTGTGVALGPTDASPSTFGTRNCGARESFHQRVEVQRELMPAARQSGGTWS